MHGAAYRRHKQKKLPLKGSRKFSGIPEKGKCQHNNKSVSTCMCWPQTLYCPPCICNDEVKAAHEKRRRWSRRARLAPWIQIHRALTARVPWTISALPGMMLLILWILLRSSTPTRGSIPGTRGHRLPRSHNAKVEAAHENRRRWSRRARLAPWIQIHYALTARVPWTISTLPGMMLLILWILLRSSTPTRASIPGTRGHRLPHSHNAKVEAAHEK